MHLKYSVVSLSALIAGFALQAAPNPLFPETITVEGQELQKLGEYRYTYRFFFELYDVALFVPAGKTAEDVLEATSAFRLQFRYLREIDKQIILKSADRMLEKNLSSSERTQIAGRVERINRDYTTVQEGDRSSLTYLPESGTTLRINGEPKATLEGRDFAKLYFRIWLGPQAISAKLKRQLLNLD